MRQVGGIDCPDPGYVAAEAGLGFRAEVVELELQAAVGCDAGPGGGFRPGAADLHFETRRCFRRCHLFEEIAFGVTADGGLDCIEDFVPGGCIEALLEGCQIALVGGEHGLLELWLGKGVGEAVAAEGFDFVPTEAEELDGVHVFVGDVGIPTAAIVGVETDGDAEAEVFDEGVLEEVWCVVEEAVGDEVDLDEVTIVAHEEHGVGVVDEIDAVADAGGPKEEGVADFGAGGIFFAGVDAERDVAVAAAGFAEGLEHAQGVAFVVVFAAGGVDAYEEVSVAGYEFVEVEDLLLDVGAEADDGDLKTIGDSGGGDVGLFEAGLDDGDGFVGGVGAAVGFFVEEGSPLAFDVAEAFGTEELEILGEEFGEEVGVAGEGGEAGDDFFEELVAVLTGLVEDVGGEPGLLLFGSEGVEGRVVGLAAGGEFVEGGGADVLEDDYGAVFGIGAGMKAGAGVVAVAEFLDIDGGFEDVVGVEAEGGVVVEVSALGEGLEEGVKLRGCGAVSDLGKARGEVLCGGGCGEEAG